MAPSTPPPPNRELFAALTIASTIWTVMSPRSHTSRVIAKHPSSPAVVGELEHLEQFGDCFVALSAARIEHLCDVRAQVVLHEQLVQGAEGLLYGKRLRDDVHAVIFVLDHLLDASKLALEDAGTVQGPLLDIGNHAIRITL